MELVEFGTDDAGEVAAFASLTRVVDAVDCPWEPMRTTYRQVMYMRHSWEGEPGRWFVAFEDGEPVGTAVLDTSEYDNHDLAWFTLRVAPAYRRRGLGSAMLCELEQRAAEMGRSLLGMEGWDAAATQGFAASTGYALKSVEVRRVQTLAGAPDVSTVLGEVVASAGDYELLRIDGRTPEDLMPAVVALSAAINDAPIDELEYEDEVYSPDRVRAYESAQIESGFRFRRLLARHKRSGEVAGHTVVVVDEEQPTVAEQHDTSVVRAHRGHRLGLVLKAGMMLWLAEEEPQLSRVYTNNAESNRHMIDVNDRLGYRPVGRILQFQKRHQAR
ncbi:MAG TPA: GNAT family N-acetyltransferase [Marmoricola sp.]